MSFSLLSLSLLPAAPARAQAPDPVGYGPPVYTSPGAGATFGNPSQTYPYGSYNGYGGGGPGPASCAGQMKATFTWSGGSGNAPPPQTVIVTQTGSASWQVYGDSGSCDDGLGDAAAPSTVALFSPGNGTPWPFNSAVSQGTHYKTQSGGASVEVDCTPTASVPMGYGAATASVAYSASVSPVTIKVSVGGGTPTVAAQDGLAGQQITATLNGIVGASPGNITYQWSVSGAEGPNPIKNWDYKAPGDGNAAQVVPLATSDYTGSQFSFYDFDPDTMIINCTANITFDDGTTGTVTATSQPVALMAPSAVWVVNGPGNNPPAGLYYAGSSKNYYKVPAYYMGAYEWWSPTSIIMPSGFTNVGGLGGFAQTLQNITGSYTGTQGTYVATFHIDGSANYEPFQSGLDLEFPYAGVQWSISTQTGEGVSGNMGDIPAQPYQFPLTGTTGWTRASAGTNTYQTWLMYQPPGGIWVPLQTITWGWWATAQNASPNDPPSEWTFSGGLNSPTSPNALIGEGATTKTPPAWSHVITPGSFLPQQ